MDSGTELWNITNRLVEMVTIEITDLTNTISLDYSQ